MWPVACDVRAGKGALMKRLHFLAGLSVISISALAGAGCLPVAPSDGNSGNGSSTYTYCYCDADCPSGSVCDEEYGKCILPASTGGHVGSTGGAGGHAGH